AVTPALSAVVLSSPPPLACVCPFLFLPAAPTPIDTLSLHDALPIFLGAERGVAHALHRQLLRVVGQVRSGGVDDRVVVAAEKLRSEEHTSELQSRFDLVCRLLLEKKNSHT